GAGAGAPRLPGTRPQHRAAEPRLLDRPAALPPHRPEGAARQGTLLPNDLVHVTEEPRIDGGEPRHLVDAQPAPERLADVPEPLRVRDPEALAQLGIARRRARLEAEAADLERAERLLERLLAGPSERPPPPHRPH